jgi:hypothetical protein
MKKETVIKFCHLKNLHGKGVITIASKLIHTDNDYIINFGVSYSSPKDVFKKSLGRVIAENRMNDNSTGYVKLDSDEITHKGIMNAILNTIIENKSYPDWAKEVILDRMEWYYSRGSDLSSIYKEKIQEKIQIDLVISWIRTIPDVDPKLLGIMILGLIKGI